MTSVNRSFRAAVSFILLAAALFLLPFSAYADLKAVSPAFIPVALPALGADAYTIATLIAGLMGVDLSYDNFDAVLNMNMFSPAVLPTSDSLLWVKHVGSGIVQFGLNKFGYDYMSGVSSSFISDKGIQSDTSGSISSGTLFSYGGYPLVQYSPGGAYFSDSFGILHADYGTVGTYSSSGAYYVTFRRPDLSHYSYSFYGPSGLISSFSGTNSWRGSVNYDVRLQAGTDKSVRLICSDHSSSSISAGQASNPFGTATSTAYSSSYSSGSVDTSIGSSLPSTGGAVISFPYSGPEDTQAALEELTRLVLAGDPSVSISLSDDVGSPQVSTQTIADTPYSSLSGALSGISSLLGTISTSISQAAEAVISGDTGFFGNVVSALAAPFEPVFAIFRSGVGIWRYVVSWVGSISAPFTWSLSALGGAGSIFLSPIYAAAAGAVVLAVYKKFGR